MRICVIIPAFCEAAHIEDAVYCAQRVGDSVIVVDGASPDDTAARALRAGAQVVQTARGRGQQLHAGALAAAGCDVLLFLHADARLPSAARASIERALRDPAVAGGNFKLAFVPRVRWARFFSWANHLRRRLLDVYYGDSGLFVRRTVYEELGGFRALPVMEDYELIRRLERQYRTSYVQDVEITASARRFAQHPVRTLALWATVHSLYFAGVPASWLAQLYRPPQPGGRTV